MNVNENDRVYLIKNANMLVVYTVLTCLVGMRIFAVRFFIDPFGMTTQRHSTE